MSWWLDESIPEDPIEHEYTFDFRSPVSNRGFGSRSIYYLTWFLNGKYIMASGSSPSAAMEDMRQKIQEALAGLGTAVNEATEAMGKFKGASPSILVPDEIERARKKRSNTGPRPSRAFGHNGKKRY